MYRSNLKVKGTLLNFVVVEKIIQDTNGIVGVLQYIVGELQQVSVFLVVLNLAFVALVADCLVPILAFGGPPPPARD
jgi:hypothetical protein